MEREKKEMEVSREGLDWSEVGVSERCGRISVDPVGEIEGDRSSS